MGSRKLDGRVAVVTGASKGMGRAFATALCRHGARVVLMARGSPELESAAAALGSSAVAIACDVGNADNVRGAFLRAVDRFGGIDILVNNAAMSSLIKVENASDAAIQREIAVNLMGPIYCTREAIPHLRRGQGDLVFISSESVRLPYPYLGIYAATKGGLEVFSAAMRAELRDCGIRVTTLRAGGVSGGQLSKGWDPLVAAEFRATIARTGHAALTGGSASPAAMAEALLGILTLDRDINVDLIEVRASAAVSTVCPGSSAESR